MSEDTCGCTCGKRGCASRPGRRGQRAGVTVHGVSKGYELGCRCEPCRTAAFAATSRRKKRTNEGTRPGAKKHGQTWTGPELEMAVRDDLTIREVAAILGRTYRAVENARARCRKDPKTITMLGNPTP